MDTYLFKGLVHLLPTGSDESGVLVVGSIHVVILPACQKI